MKVILQQDVKGQGKRGQLVNVSDGYARNFLFPKNLAVPANADNMNKMIMQDKAKKDQMDEEKARLSRRSPSRASGPISSSASWGMRSSGPSTWWSPKRPDPPGAVPCFQRWCFHGRVVPPIATNSPQH